MWRSTGNDVGDAADDGVGAPEHMAVAAQAPEAITHLGAGVAT